MTHKIRYLACFYCLLLCLSAITAVAQAPIKPVKWTFWKEASGVKIYYRESAGSSIKEVKMTFDIFTTPTILVAALQDIEAYPKWVYRSTTSRVVNRYTPLEVDYYNYIDFPWPLADRDIAMHSTIAQDPHTRIITSTSVCQSALVPRVADVVRISEMQSRWVFTPVAKGKMSSEHTFRSNPGGNIPAWMVNLALDEGPLRTIEGLRKLLRQQKYHNVAVAGIID
jgi:hypothetical protein